MASVWASTVAAQTIEKPDGALRVALFNAHLARKAEGALITELRSDAPRTAAQMAAIAEILQRVRPDVLLILELDYDVAGEALGLFEAALAAPRGGAAALAYPHRFSAPVNTGAPSGLDLDGDGALGGPGDAYGWGLFPGQFGMAVLSRWPVAQARAFQHLRWSAAPWAAPPRAPGAAAFYAPEVWEALRLSSKSHWDVGLRRPDGGLLRLYVSHPTPPVFDGPEDRNGARNAAEIRFWLDYLNGAEWIVDDAGRVGGASGEPFVLIGDLNADPVDGDGRHSAIQALLDHPRVQDPKPSSAGGAAAAIDQAGANAAHRGPAALDTADFKDALPQGPGNLRVDYVLPSSELRALGAGVFWPAPGDPLRRLVGEGFPLVSSDHRLVWVDLAVE